jgi:hypothetical protein
MGHSFLNLFYMAKDKCVICGVETPYEFETHIDLRIGYIEGAGQLCKVCYDGKSPTISVPHHVIYNTPNDFELGEKVRRMYYANR